MRLLGSGGETMVRGSGSGYLGQGEPEPKHPGAGVWGREPQWGIFSFAPPSRMGPILSSFDLEGSSLSWNIPENMPFQPSILYPYAPQPPSPYMGRLS